MRKQQKAILVLAMITAFVATAAFLPGLVRAGSLQPSDPPGSTMKTLDEVPPTWSQKLHPSKRFRLIFYEMVSIYPVLTYDHKAVLDKETGLVWERSPDTTRMDWYEACEHCYNREVGGRKGWRLPTIEELASLIDTTNTTPALPTGHPFSNVQSAWYKSRYWSSTACADNPQWAWAVHLNNGDVLDYGKEYSAYYVWCVRGGHGHDEPY